MVTDYLLSIPVSLKWLKFSVSVMRLYDFMVVFCDCVCLW